MFSHQWCDYKARIAVIKEAGGGRSLKLECCGFFKMLEGLSYPCTVFLKNCGVCSPFCLVGSFLTRLELGSIKDVTHSFPALKGRDCLEINCSAISQVTQTDGQFWWCSIFLPAIFTQKGVGRGSTWPSLCSSAIQLRRFPTILSYEQVWFKNVL